MNSTAKKSSKPTLNIAQLIHIIMQIENLTGKSVDDLINIFFSGNVSADLQTLFLDTFARIKNQPVDVGVNAVAYAIVYKYLKKTAGPMAARIDMGFFYLKPI